MIVVALGNMQGALFSMQGATLKTNRFIIG